MAKKMLIDATHAEETRVVVVDGHRLVEFDYESKVRKQLKGSIFLAKVTRVEPSLQAAFVNFGGNRHGFLPFSEIHPDYYRIPIADREKLIAEQRAAMEAEEAALAAEEERQEELAARQNGEDGHHTDEEDDVVDEVGGDLPPADEAALPADAGGAGASDEAGQDDDPASGSLMDADRDSLPADEDADPSDDIGNRVEDGTDDVDGNRADGSEEDRQGREDGEGGRRWGRGRGGRWNNRNRGRGGRRMSHRSRSVEIVGGDSADGETPYRPNMRRQYKIQEVIKRGQIMLIQVSKEERGNKGAAVSTYLSLPGRYCVLMPNSPRGGGVSRKIASFDDRRRMREILNELNVPEGMSVIMRTAGVARNKAEIKRDLDYMLRMWDNIRELTLKSSAPALIYEEGDLIKRAIRDLYDRDTDEIHVAGAEGFKTARDFMKMLIPSHVKRVNEYKDDKIPLFHRYQVEQQISDIGEPSVTLRSGGYLVINPTEALVSIDVNSGRATKERHIEETALKTNLEAADEVARQLRLRDLGGLVVIDFIDMEDRRNNARVERRLKDALSSDRARIQVGRISSFGLLELSRQRLNPSLTETQAEKCPHCKGVGYIKTVDSVAINALRAVEQEGIKERAAEVALSVPTTVALYILNNKREMLVDLERRYGFRISIRTDEALVPAGYQVDVVKGISAHREEDSGDEDETAAAEEGQEENTRSRERSDEHRSRQGAEQRDGEGRDRDGERGGRRRGRRGGRRRNGRFRDDAAQESAPREDGDFSEMSSEEIAGEEEYVEAVQVEAMQTEVEPQAEVTAEEPEAEEKPKRGRGRRPSARKAAAEVSEEPPQEEVVSADDGEERKPASRRGRGSSRKTQEKAPEPAQEESAAAVAAAPSNDTRKPQSSTAYETVTETPTQKKRGWWNRLVE